MLSLKSFFEETNKETNIHHDMKIKWKDAKNYLRNIKKQLQIFAVSFMKNGK